MTRSQNKAAQDPTPEGYRSRILNLIHQIDQHEAKIMEECAAHRAVLNGMLEIQKDRQRGEAWKSGT